MRFRLTRSTESVRLKKQEKEKEKEIMNKTEKISVGNQTVIIFKGSRKVFAIEKPEGGITQDPLKIRSAQLKVDEYFRIVAESLRFQAEWDKRPLRGEKYGWNCYRAHEVALTDEEYDRWG